MLVYEKLGEGGSGNIDALQQNHDIPKDITDKLQKLGFQMDSATFSRIQEANQQDTFAQDLSAALINPAEKGRIDQLYLKGFGQVMETQYGPLSFAEINKHTDKKNILNGMTRSEKSDFLDWIEQAANQRVEIKKGVEQSINQEEKKIDTNIQAGNQRVEIKKGVEQSAIESAKTFEKKLQSSTDTIRSLSSLPPDIEQKALAEATKNPPKELVGVPPEQYGEYKNLILADYTISHANEIEKSLSISDRDTFDKSIKEMGDIIGRRPSNWPEIVETRGGLVLGERREEIRSLGERYIRDGYDESVVWDSQSRSLIFRGKNGEKIIDTAPIPPEERITEAGISISREAPSVALSPSTLSHQKTERSIISELDTMSQNDATRGRIDTTLQAKIDRGFDRAKMSPDTTDKLDATNDALTHKKTALEQLIQYYKEKGEGAEANALESNLSIVNSQIRKIADMRATYEKSLENLRNETDKIEPDNFDSIARTNLDWLTSEDTLFQRMGPSANRALYRIIDMINQYRDPANQISLSSSALDITDKQNIQAGYQKLGGEMSTLRDGEKIRDFQQQISGAVEKPVGAPGSIEALLMATSDTKPKIPQEQAQNILSPER